MESSRGFKGRYGMKAVIPGEALQNRQGEDSMLSAPYQTGPENTKASREGQSLPGRPRRISFWIALGIVVPEG